MISLAFKIIDTVLNLNLFHKLCVEVKQFDVNLNRSVKNCYSSACVLRVKIMFSKLKFHRTSSSRRVKIMDFVTRGMKKHLHLIYKLKRIQTLYLMAIFSLAVSKLTDD